MNISGNSATRQGGGVNVNSSHYEISKSELSLNYGVGAVLQNATDIVFFVSKA